MKAVLSNYKQTPRKTRLVADLVKGKSVADALITLKFLEKRASGPMAKLIASAAANAERQGESSKDLMIKSLSVTKGLVRRTMMPRAMGSGKPINHRSSHITVLLVKGTPKVKKAKKK